MTVKAPYLEPDPHVLRIEQRPARTDDATTSHGVQVFLDDKPLSRVTSIDVRYAFDEFVTATITMELHGVEIPGDAVRLEVITVEPEDG